MLMSHVQRYTMIIVSNSHGISKYVKTVTIFQKLKEKVNEPKMTFEPTPVEVTCVITTQGPLYLSPMKIYQNMQIQ